MLVLENVFKNVSHDIKKKIQALWKSEGALEDEKLIEERLSQVVYIVLDSETGNRCRSLHRRKEKSSGIK